MTTTEFTKLMLLATRRFRLTTPYRTGNLRFNAVQTEQRSPNAYRIIVNEDIASYMPYTNEPWIHPRWRGKKNPNERWFQRGALDLTRFIASQCHARIRRGK